MRHRCARSRCRQRVAQPCWTTPTLLRLPLSGLCTSRCVHVEKVVVPSVRNLSSYGICIVYITAHHHSYDQSGNLHEFQYHKHTVLKDQTMGGHMQVLMTRPREEWKHDVAGRYKALEKFSKEDARLQFLRILRSLPYGTSVIRHVHNPWQAS